MARSSGWDRAWTLDRLRKSQPDPWKRLIPPELFTPYQSPPLSTKRRVVAGNTARGDSAGKTQSFRFVDPETGELHNDKRAYSITVECAERKQTRRHVILKSGHGGRNGATKYHKHEEC